MRGRAAAPLPRRLQLGCRVQTEKNTRGGSAAPRRQDGGCACLRPGCVAQSPRLLPGRGPGRTAGRAGPVRCRRADDAQGQAAWLSRTAASCMTAGGSRHTTEPCAPAWTLYRAAISFTESLGCTTAVWHTAAGAGGSTARASGGPAGDGARRRRRSAAAAAPGGGGARRRRRRRQLSALTGAVHRHGPQAEQGGQQQRGPHRVEAQLV